MIGCRIDVTGVKDIIIRYLATLVDRNKDARPCHKNKKEPFGLVRLFCFIILLVFSSSSARFSSRTSTRTVPSDK